MKRAARSTAQSGALLLNKSKSPVVSKVAKKDTIVVEDTDQPSKKTNHYLLTEIKGNENENEIAFVLTGSTESEHKPPAECREEIQIEEPCEDMEEDDDDEKVNTEEIVEHVCGKCYKSFRTIKVLKRHIKYCLFNSEMEMRKAKMMKNINKIEKEAVIMEKKDLCFCCGESYDTCHLGHVNCPECPKSFKSQLILERHTFLIHSENQEFPCTICNGFIRTEKLLQLHIEQHKSRGKPFACKRCGKDFTRQYHLRRHLLYTSCGEGQVETMKCKVCSKEFYRLDNLRAHLKSHLGHGTTKRSEYTCPYCKKCFYSLSTLNIHVRTHTGERPYDCDLCDKNFPSVVALKKHRRYHTGEKPYTCSVCHQNFAVKEVLNRHMKRHTGERKHVCEICDKRFIQATQLKNHQRTHLRPYECDQCDEKFKTEKQLEKHVKAHNRANGLTRRRRKVNKIDKKCPECGEEFPDTASARYHKLTEHTDTNEQLETTENQNSVLEDEEEIEEKHENTEKIKKEESDCVVIGEFIIESLPVDTATLLEKSGQNFEVIAEDKDVKEDIPGIEKSKSLTTTTVSSNLKAELRKSLAQQLQDDTVKPAAEKPMSPEDIQITENVNKLLDILVDLETLVKFGWLSDNVENVLCKVIENCGYSLHKTKFTDDYGTRMREYVKLLFTVVIQNDSIKELLNNYSIDEVIDFVLSNEEAD